MMAIKHASQPEEQEADATYEILDIALAPDITAAPKRKRHSIAVHDSPSRKRVARQTQPTDTDVATSSKGAKSRPLGRPKKSLQHQQPAIIGQKISEHDVYEVPNLSAESTRTALVRKSTNSKTNPSGKPSAGGDRAKASTRLARQVPTSSDTSPPRRAKPETTPPIGRRTRAAGGMRPTTEPDWSKKPEHDAQRAKKRKNIHHDVTSSPINAKREQRKNGSTPPRRQTEEESCENGTGVTERTPRSQGQTSRVSSSSYVNGGSTGADGGEGASNDDASDDEASNETDKEGDDPDDEANEPKGASDTEHLELLGQDRAWTQILNGARKNCRPFTKCKKPKHLTQTIKTLTSSIVQVYDLYNDLALGNSLGQESSDEIQEELREKICDVKSQIQEVKESNTGKESSEMIRDIYAVAVPAMVFVLESAMTCRTSEGPQTYTFAGLQEIVLLQELTLKLCEKTKIWEAKPHTSRPIIRPVRSMIYPYLRDSMARTFALRLDELRVLEKRKQNALRYANSQEERFEGSQRERSRSQLKAERQWRNIAEDIDREREIFRSSWRNPPCNVPQANRQSRQSSVIHENRAQWTREEDFELVMQLLNPKSRHLSGMSPTNDHHDHDTITDI